MVQGTVATATRPVVTGHCLAHTLGPAQASGAPGAQLDGRTRSGQKVHMSPF